MDCPYCLTACNDKVLVCPNCKRDLIFFVPISKEISRLNQKVDDFFDQLQRVKLEVIGPVSNRAEVLSKIVDAGKLVLVYALQWAILKPLVENFTWLELSLYWAYSLAAVPYGVWLGFRRSSGAGYFILVGIGLGLTDFALRGTLYSWTWPEARLFFISDLLWFYTGCILGRKLARWIGSVSDRRTQRLTVAELMQGEAKTARRRPSLNERGERFKEYAAVLIPLLSIISTIIAIFTKK